MNNSVDSPIHPTIYFGHDRVEISRLPENSILISANGGDWNDFGHQTRVVIEYSLRIKDRPVVGIAHAYLSFLDADSPRTSDSFKVSSSERIKAMLEKAKEDFITLPDGCTFFSMLASMKEYRNFVKKLSPAFAKEVLLAINDVVAQIQYVPGSRIIANAIRTEEFNLSFLRDSEAFFAYKNAGPVLKGLELEEFAGLSQVFEMSFKLQGNHNSHDLSFHFDHQAVLPKRMAIIIGKNGVGKSQVLARLVKSSLGGLNELTDGQGGRPILSRILAFAPTNEAKAVFPDPSRIREPRTWYKRFTLNRSRGEKNGESIMDLIVQLARSSDNIGENSRWNIFCTALSAISRYQEISFPVEVSTLRYIPIEEFVRTNEERRLLRFASVKLKREPARLIDGKAYPLSSGELSFLKFVAQVSLNIENGSLLLLDEPETHLHPNFISKFTSLLDKLLQLTGSAAIIATHSAYFVREVFKEQVTVLRVEDGIVTAEKPRLKTFGADVGAISYFVFGEDEPSQLAREVEQRLANSQHSWEELLATYGDELSLEFMNSLRANVEPGE